MQSCSLDHETFKIFIMKNQAQSSVVRKRSGRLTKKEIAMMERVSVLTKKKQTYKLKPKEYIEYLYLNQELSGLPALLFTDELRDKISKVINKTDKLIKLVSKKTKKNKALIDKIVNNLPKNKKKK